MMTQKEKGAIVANPSDATIAQTADAMIEGMKDGSILNRSGRRYKLVVAQGYQDAFRNHLTFVSRLLA